MTSSRAASPQNSHGNRRRFALPRGMAIAFAVIAATGSAAAQPPEAATHSTPPLAYPYAISPVDIHAATLRGQPNMHGIGVMTGPDGHPRVFCVDPSEPDQAFRLHRNMQAGVDAVRYQ